MVRQQSELSGLLPSDCSFQIAAGAIREVQIATFRLLPKFPVHLSNLKVAIWSIQIAPGFFSGLLNIVVFFLLRFDCYVFANIAFYNGFIAS